MTTPSGDILSFLTDQKNLPPVCIPSTNIPYCTNQCILQYKDYDTCFEKVSLLNNGSNLVIHIPSTPEKGPFLDYGGLDQMYKYRPIGIIFQVPGQVYRMNADGTKIQHATMEMNIIHINEPAKQGDTQRYLMIKYQFTTSGTVPVNGTIQTNILLRKFLELVGSNIPKPPGSVSGSTKGTNVVPTASNSKGPSMYTEITSMKQYKKDASEGSKYAANCPLSWSLVDFIPEDDLSFYIMEYTPTLACITYDSIFEVPESFLQSYIQLVIGKDQYATIQKEQIGMKVDEIKNPPDMIIFYKRVFDIPGENGLPSIKPGTVEKPASTTKSSSVDTEGVTKTEPKVIEKTVIVEKEKPGPKELTLKLESPGGDVQTVQSKMNEKGEITVQLDVATEPPKKWWQKWWVWVLIVILVFWIVVGILIFVYKDRLKQFIWSYVYIGLKFKDMITQYFGSLDPTIMKQYMDFMKVPHSPEEKTAFLDSMKQSIYSNPTLSNANKEKAYQQLSGHIERSDQDMKDANIMQLLTEILGRFWVKIQTAFGKTKVPGTNIEMSTFAPTNVQKAYNQVAPTVPVNTGFSNVPSMNKNMPTNSLTTENVIPKAKENSLNQTNKFTPKVEGNSSKFTSNLTTSSIVPSFASSTPYETTEEDNMIDNLKLPGAPLTNEQSTASPIVENVLGKVITTSNTPLPLSSVPASVPPLSSVQRGGKKTKVVMKKKKTTKRSHSS
jgi:hypothetical protein